MAAYTNAHQSIPAQFKEIMRNDKEREALYALPAIPFHKMVELIRERRQYSRQAEKLLRWNTDKGNTK